MTANGWIQIALFCVIVTLIVKPFGGYMTRVFTGERTFLSPGLAAGRTRDLRVCGVDEKQEQHWVTYALAMLFLSLVGFLRSTPCSGFQAYCRSIRRASRGSSRASPSTPR